MLRGSVSTVMRALLGLVARKQADEILCCGVQLNTDIAPTVFEAISHVVGGIGQLAAGLLVVRVRDGLPDLPGVAEEDLDVVGLDGPKMPGA